MPIKHNIQRVRQSVKDDQGRYNLRTRAMARKMGAEGRDLIRKNIKSRGAGGVFSGYAITGALAKGIVSSEPTKQGNGWVSRIRFRGNQKTRRYAEIHERGGVIRAKKAPYLVFYIPNVGWRRAKQVRIKAKRYFAKGIDQLRKNWTTERIRRELRG